MSAGESLFVSCSESPDGSHRWQCITVQDGDIIGVDSTGAPVFIPDNTAGHALDFPSLGQQAYGCAHCDVVWDESLTTT